MTTNVDQLESEIISAPRDTKRMRAIRVDDELWQAAHDALAQTPDPADPSSKLNVSRYTRIALAALVADPERCMWMLNLYGHEYARDRRG